MKPNIRMFPLLALGLFLLAQSAQADWQPAKRLTWTSGASQRAQVAVDSAGVVHLVWEDVTPGNFQVYYKKSADGGGTWSTKKRLTWTSSSCSDPAIAVDSSDRLHIVFTDNASGNGEIYYKRSTNGGTNWSAGKRLTWTSGDSWQAALTVDSLDNLHVVWQDFTPGDKEIYYSASTDGGATWSTGERISWTEYQSEAPDIVSDPFAAVHVVWRDDTPGNKEVFYRKSTDGGTNWAPTRRLTWNSDISDNPSISCDKDADLHLVWNDHTPGNDEIYYMKSTNGGATWSAKRRLTWNPDDSVYPEIFCGDDGKLHLVWADYTPGDSEIFYRSSPDSGATWTAAERLTWNLGFSDRPGIGVFGTAKIHVVWADDSPGNYEIYYARQK